MDNRTNKQLLSFAYFAGFVFGLALCFDSVFMPEFKTWFGLDYTRQMYIVFFKNIPFLFFSIPIGYAIRKTGYKNCLALSILCFGLGTWLLVPGLLEKNYRLVLTAFFINGIAFNLELVSWNPMLALLGPSQTAASRLNLGNALGAIAQIVAPLCIFLIIPAAVVEIGGKLPYMVTLFRVLSACLVLLGLAAFFIPGRMSGGRLVTEGQPADDGAGEGFGELPAPHGASRHRAAPTARENIWLTKKVLGCFVAIFLLLGAEAGMFGLYRNFLEDPAVAGFSSHRSQQFFMFYFALFAAGRLGGWLIQRRLSPRRHLLVNLAAAAVLMILAIVTHGLLAVCCFTAAGFFVSIFFPSLYAIAIEGLGAQTSVASGLLSMGMLGAALIPLFQGWLADQVGVQSSFWLVLVPYVFTGLFLGKKAG